MKRKRRSILTTATLTHYVPGLHAHEEFTRSVIRPRGLTYRGVVRALVNDGRLTNGRGVNVTRIEHAVIQ